MKPKSLRSIRRSGFSPRWGQKRLLFPQIQFRQNTIDSIKRQNYSSRPSKWTRQIQNKKFSFFLYFLKRYWFLSFLSKVNSYLSLSWQQEATVQVIMKLFAPRLCNTCWIFDGVARFKSFQNFSYGTFLANFFNANFSYDTFVAII